MKKIIYYILTIISMENIYTNNKTYNIQTFYKKFWPNFYSIKDSTKNKQLQFFLKHKKFVKNIGIIKTQLIEANNFNSKITNIFILYKFEPIAFVKKIIKLIKFYKSPLNQLESTKHLLKTNKDKILSKINFEFQQLITVYENKIFKKRMKINKILTENLKSENVFLGKKRFIKTEYDIFYKNNQNKMLLQQNQLFNINKISLIDKTLILHPVSYNSLIINEKIKLINNFKFINYFNFFNINISYNNHRNLNQNDNKSNWNIIIETNNIMNISEIFRKNININNKNIIQQNKKFIYESKDQLRKSNYKNYKKNYLLIKQYRKKTLDLLNNYNEYFKEKYKTNFYNKRYYYEFLITKYNVTINYIKLQQNFVQYQWKFLLKTPFSKIKV